MAIGKADRAKPLDEVPSGLEISLSNLEMLGVRLRVGAARIFYLAVLSIISVVGLTVLTKTIEPALVELGVFFQSLRLVAFLCAIIWPTLGLISVFLWDRQVRDGMILFEEISDEVEWQHRTYRTAIHDVPKEPQSSVQEKEFPGNERPDMQIRIRLRQFLRDASLPFIQDPSASVRYVVFFVACIVLVVLFAPSVGRVFFPWQF